MRQSNTRERATTRAGETRNAILHQCFAAMHAQGFAALRPDAVVESMGITKGALYYYFPSKKELGLAIIREIIQPRYLGIWQAISGTLKAQGTADVDLPQNVHAALDGICANQKNGLEFGCPLTNLIQEMTNNDSDFRESLSGTNEDILTLIASVFMAGLRSGQFATPGQFVGGGQFGASGQFAGGGPHLHQKIGESGEESGEESIEATARSWAYALWAGIMGAASIGKVTRDPKAIEAVYAQLHLFISSITKAASKQRQIQEDV